MELFLDSYAQAPKQIVLDLDATEAPLHGEQEDRFFHGYYDHYCYLPLYIFCGKQLLCAKLRPANIDGSAGAIEELERILRQIRERWPHTRIILRADSGFAREALMAGARATRFTMFSGSRATHVCNAPSAPSCTMPGNAARLPHSPRGASKN